MIRLITRLGSCDVNNSGWVVSSTLAGATVGSFTGGALADKLGRKRTFQLNALPLIVGTLLRSETQSLQYYFTL